MGALPNLLIAGVAKAGTTSLFWQLADHPDICPSDIKELHYFSPLQHGAEPRPVVEYVEHFAHCTGERYRLEASPEYFYGGPAVRQAIAKTLDRPRVLISLREPVGRVWSAYTFLKSMGRLDPQATFEQMVDVWSGPLEDIRSGRAGAVQTPISVNFYVETLRAWDEQFGSALHVLLAEYLFADPQDTMDDVFAWLGLPPHRLAPSTTRRRNETLHARSTTVARLAYRAQGYSNRVLRRVPSLRAALRRAYAAVNATTSAEKMPPGTRASLERLYAEPNRELADFLRQRGHRQLPGWLQNEQPS